jgi:tungstate transport system ATP-binding protein
MTWNVVAQEAHKRQAYVFQTPIMMRRTALDNVAYPLIVHGTPRAQARDIATGWLARVGLADSGTKRAQVLSGGERQKLALARALIRGPELLFLDEPCANLDGRATREIEELLLQARQAGTGIIMATHDMGQARRLAQLMGGTTSNGLSDDILNGGENAPTSDVLFIHRGIIHEHQRANDFFVNPQTPEAQAFINGDIVE